MKRIVLTIMILFAIAMAGNAQFGNQLLDRVKRKAEQKANEKTDKAVDKAADKAEEKLTKKKKKKGSQAVEEQAVAAVEEPAPASDEPASETVVTVEGTAFKGNKLTVTNIIFSEKTYDFDPNPNPVLNGVGTTLQQKLKKEKLLIKIYQRTSGDNASKAEEEFMAIKMYLVNRFDLNEDRIYFSTPSAKKAGANRTVEFVMVPDSFMFEDAGKY